MTIGNHKLGLRETTALVIGAVIGADIYVCASFGAQYLGPAGLLAWAAAAAIALCIALCLAQCAWRIPVTGGPYAYVNLVLGTRWGFLAGWAQLMAELMALAAYPAALARYIPLPGQEGKIATLVFPATVILFLTIINYFGTVPAARVNTALTAAKLVPLVLFISLGALFVVLYPQQVSANLHPFLPFGWSGFGEALVLVFWAYAGFEHATFPAREIQRPSHTIPLALITGMGIATFIYLSVTFTISAVLPWRDLIANPNPLSEAFSQMAAAIWPAIASWAALVMTVGAVLSIAGADETGTLSTSWLIFAFAADGHLPAFLARLHPRYQVPHIALIMQNMVVFAICVLLPLESLIRATTFLLGIVYLLTCAAACKLNALAPAPGILGCRILPYAGAVLCLLLLSQVRAPEMAAGLLLLIPALVARSIFKPKRNVELFQYTQSRSYQLRWINEYHRRFLAQLYLWITSIKLNRLRMRCP